MDTDMATEVVMAMVADMATAMALMAMWRWRRNRFGKG
jgi:hypothetical protein